MVSNLEYLQTFLVAGFTVSGISYLGNTMNPLLAGILSGIPISIPSLLLIRNEKCAKEFIFSASIMVTVVWLITILCWYLYVKLNLSVKKAVTISIISWLICACIYYLCVVNGKKS